MAEEFVMPKLGLTMEAGKIVRWLVADGAEVEQGQAVLVIETDKVESEVESSRAGRLAQTAAIGEEYACGARLGWFLAEGEQQPGPVPVAAAATSGPGPVAGWAAPAASPARATIGLGGRVLASPNARRVAAERGVDLRLVSGTGPGGRITSEDVFAAPPPPAAVPPVETGFGLPSGNGGAGHQATIAARSLADLLGVDLREVVPAGPDPRITKEDVAAHVRTLLARLATPAAAERGASAPRLLQQPTAVMPLSGMRGTIAGRMSDSLSSMAQLTLMMDVDMDGVVADRARRAETGPAPGYTDYVIGAAAAALVDHPLVNSQITADGIALLPQVNVGIAVALDDGLIVPVVADTPSLALDALAAETSRLAEAARTRTLELQELEGGTFSVTALGMFGVDGFTPIINPPNTAILGVGRLRDDVAWADDGSPVKATRLTLSLTWDHRAFDGAPAAEFTRAIKERLEAYG